MNDLAMSALAINGEVIHVEPAELLVNVVFVLYPLLRVVRRPLNNSSFLRRSALPSARRAPLLLSPRILLLRKRPRCRVGAGRSVGGINAVAQQRRRPDPRRTFARRCRLPGHRPHPSRTPSVPSLQLHHPSTPYNELVVDPSPLPP
jgi:hypothetical protein